MLCDEGIVVKVRIGAIHAVNILKLSGAEGFVFIEAPDSLHQSLPTQHLMQTGDAATESVGGVKEGGIAIGHLNTEP